MNVTSVGIHDSVAIDFPPRVLRDALAEMAPDVRIVGDDVGELRACDALVTFAHSDVFLDAELVWVHSTQAGVDSYPVERYAERGITLTNSTGIHGTTVGETTVGFMLMLARRLHTLVRHQQEHEWDRPAWDEAFTLDGTAACVVGLGTVGTGIAERAAGLGVSVTGVRRTQEPVRHVETVHPPDELTAAIRGQDFVILAVPLTTATEGLIGAPELDAMGDDAYLINVARGAVVEEAALVDAIRGGSIAGAALDVFTEEPLPPDSPLWELDDVIVSPHAAVADREFYVDVADLVRRTLDRLRTDGDPPNRVV